MTSASQVQMRDPGNPAQRPLEAAPDITRAPQRRPVGLLTIGDVVTLLALPGKTHEARMQLLRRLEARGVVPPARRSLISGRRYWDPREVSEIRRSLAEAA